MKVLKNLNPGDLFALNDKLVPGTHEIYCLLGKGTSPKARRKHKNYYECKKLSDTADDPITYLHPKQEVYTSMYIDFAND